MPSCAPRNSKVMSSRTAKLASGLPWRLTTKASIAKLRASPAVAAPRTSARAPRSRLMPLAPEGHARRLAIFLSVELEVLALGEAEEGRDEVGRHSVDRRVEVAHDGVVVAARVLDRVLDLTMRGLELRKDHVRLAVGVCLVHREQSEGGS